MPENIILRSINISGRKGTSKTPVEKARLIEGHGIEGDAHAGPWHRQVSLLAEEEIKAADNGRGILDYGSFAENLTIMGADVTKARLMDSFSFGDALLEVTQMGKECHDTCAIGKSLGDCIMPRLGLFTRVLAGGEIRKGMDGRYVPKRFRGLVITLSDRASSGVYRDESGKAAKNALKNFFDAWDYEYDLDYKLLPDEPDGLKAVLMDAEAGGIDVVFTSGGTGLGPRDYTPEVTAGFCERQIPGVMEFIRNKYGAQHPNALVSRGIAGVKGTMLVYNLPGSPRGVGEYMADILPTLKHSFYMLHGIDLH